MQNKTVLFLIVLVIGAAGPATAQSGVMMFEGALGSAEIPVVNAGSFDVAVGDAPKHLKTIYVPFDQYSWLIHGGFAVYNGVFPGFELGVTSTGGAFFDPYVGVDVLFFGVPKSAHEDSVFEQAPEEDFYVVGLIPEVGIRINFPATDEMAIFGAMSWAYPMTLATYGAAASLTTKIALGVTIYQ